MNEDHTARVDDGEALGEYDHVVPTSLKWATFASMVFFGGGQIIKGHFGRAVVLWILLVVVAVAIGVVAFVARGHSTLQALGLVATLGAFVVLWLYQVWDAATRR